MLQFSKRNSEHDDIYRRSGGSPKQERGRNQFEVMETEESIEETVVERDSEFEEIQKGYNIDREYEIYIETEKKYHIWAKKWFS